jgi:hypothetical protein
MFDDKTIIYVDIDHLLCDYDAGAAHLQAKYPELKYPHINELNIRIAHEEICFYKR